MFFYWIVACFLPRRIVFQHYKTSLVRTFFFCFSYFEQQFERLSSFILSRDQIFGPNCFPKKRGSSPVRWSLKIFISKSQKSLKKPLEKHHWKKFEQFWSRDKKVKISWNLLQSFRVLILMLMDTLCQTSESWTDPRFFSPQEFLFLMTHSSGEDLCNKYIGEPSWPAAVARGCKPSS